MVKKCQYSKGCDIKTVILGYKFLVIIVLNVFATIYLVKKLNESEWNGMTHFIQKNVSTDVHILRENGGRTIFISVQIVAFCCLYLFPFWTWWNEKVARNGNLYVPLKKQHGSKKRPWKRHSVSVYKYKKISICTQQWPNSRNRIVVSTPRCGRGNPGSNPGYGMIIFFRFENFSEFCKKTVLTRFKSWLSLCFCHFW